MENKIKDHGVLIEQKQRSEEQKIYKNFTTYEKMGKKERKNLKHGYKIDGRKAMRKSCYHPNQGTGPHHRSSAASMQTWKPMIAAEQVAEETVKI